MNVSSDGLENELALLASDSSHHDTPLAQGGLGNLA
jgi:hypothetical protein